MYAHTWFNRLNTLTQKPCHYNLILQFKVIQLYLFSLHYVDGINFAFYGCTDLSP